VSLGEVLTLLAYLVGGGVFWLAARERRLATDGVGKLAVIALLGGALGAKVSQLLAQGWPVTVPFLAVAQPQQGGRAILGGVIGGWLCVEIAKRRMGIRRSTGDLFALALPAGEAVGRVGCYFNGCCYGSVCTGPLKVWQHEAWRHPVQLYSAAGALGIFVALLSVRRRLRHEGDLFRLYLLLFGLVRFGLEFLRQRDTLFWGLSPMQWLSLELVAFSTITLTLRHRAKENAYAGAEA
jgi:phosphatidylglycerol:prolipoprotein diacylglycerol transferase